MVPGHKWNKVNGMLRRLHNEELYDLCCSLTIRVIKSGKTRWEEHVTHMEDRRLANRILVGRRNGERQLKSRRCRWEYNIKMDVQEDGWGRIDWIALARDKDG
jgi:hypothetical protein